MKRMEIAEKKKIPEYLNKEGALEVKVRLISLNLISSCGMSVGETLKAIGIPKKEQHMSGSGLGIRTDTRDLKTNLLHREAVQVR